MECCCGTLMLIGGAVAALLALMYKMMPKHPRRLKKDEIVTNSWQKDVVYLYQFPRSKCIPNLSPFALKVETFLRRAQLSYKCINTMAYFSYEGTIPFIELNGVQYSDSDLIIHKLTEHFHLEHLESDLSDYEQGVSRCIVKLSEQSLAEIMINNRFLRNYDVFMKTSGLLSTLNPNWLVYQLLKMDFKKRITARSNGAGIGKHSDADIEKIARADLDALSKLLSEKTFFFSDSTPHNADLCAWAVMAESYYMPFPTPTKQIIKQHPNLVQYMENMVKHFWPDWNNPPDAKNYTSKKE